MIAPTQEATRALPQLESRPPAQGCFRLTTKRMGLLKRDGYRCVYCGRDFLASVESMLLFTVDHLIPKAAGGTAANSNLVSACAPCNELKANTPCPTVAVARMVVFERRAQLVGEMRDAFGTALLEFRQEGDGANPVGAAADALGEQLEMAERTCWALRRVLAECH